MSAPGQSPDARCKAGILIMGAMAVAAGCAIVFGSAGDPGAGAILAAFGAVAMTATLFVWRAS